MPGAAYPVFWYNLKGIAQLHHDSKVVWLADYANFPDRNGGISSILTKPPYLLICRGTCTLWQFIWRTWSELCLLENEIVNYYYGSTKPWPKVQLPEVTQDLKQLQNTMALKVEESETSLEEPAFEQSLKWLVKTFYGLVCVCEEGAHPGFLWQLTLSVRKLNFCSRLANHHPKLKQSVNTVVSTKTESWNNTTTAFIHWMPLWIASYVSFGEWPHNFSRSLKVVALNFEPKFIGCFWFILGYAQ